MAEELPSTGEAFASALDEAILAHLNAKEAGRLVNEDELLARYPQVAGELRAFLDAEGAVAAALTPWSRVGAQSSADLVGSFGTYDFERVISYKGGTAVILGCRDRILNRPIAVKVLRHEYAARPGALRRFQEEAQIASQLQHPGIPPVHELGNVPDGRPYFAMKLVEGHDLTTLLQQRPSPRHDLPRFLNIFQQVCQTVAYAHSKGVLHRDLKPLNIMVGAFGEVQVMDWGFGKVLNVPGPAESASVVDGHGLTPVISQIQTIRSGVPGAESSPGRVAGTFAYMPPEQARGEVDRLDARCDVFSLGAILCEILTGQPPYVGRTKESLWKQACAAQLDPVFARLDSTGADADLLALVKSCLAADKGGRPAHAGAVAEAVTNYLNAVQQKLHAAEVQRARAEAKAAEERKRRRWQLALAGAVLLLTVGGVAGGLWYRFDRERRFQDERREQDRQQVDVAASLELFGKHLRLQHWPEAKSALERAEGRAISHATEASQQRLRQARLDLITVETIETARLRLSELHAGKPDLRDADRAFSACFAAYGVPLERSNRLRAAARIADSPIREQIIAGLDAWANMKTRLGVGQSHELLHLAQAADENHTRKDLRQSLILGQFQRFRQQPLDPKRLENNPATVWFLASNLGQLGFHQEAIALLQAGQRRHPDDFWLNFELGTQLVVSQPTSEAVTEGVGYLRAALVSRPESPLVAVNLAKGLSDLGQDQEALELLRQATTADPALAVAYAARAGILDRQMEFRAAEGAARWAVKLDPESAYCRAMLGYTLVGLNHVVEGMAHCERAVKSEPSSPEVHFALGTAFLLREFPRKALAEFSKATDLNPALTEAWVGLALAKADSGDVAGSVQAGQRAVALNYRSAIAHLGLGYAFMLGGKKTEAMAEFELPARTRQPQPSLLLQQGVALFRRKQYKEALRLFRQVERARPDYSPVYALIGYTLVELNQVADAIAACHRAVELDAQSPIAHANLGYALNKQERWREAVTECRRAVELDPECAPALGNLGHALTRLGRLKEAEEACKKAVALDDGTPEAHLNLGNVLREKGLLDAAIAQFQKTIALNPDLSEAHYNLGTILRDKGLPDQAIEQFHKAMALQPQDADLHNNLGVVLYEKRQLDEAIAEFRKALALKPDYADAHGNLGNALGDKELFDEALTECRKAVELKPGSAEFHCNYGLALDAKGRLDEAISELRKALALKPANAKSHNNLGLALKDKGFVDQAMGEWTQAIASDPWFAAAHYNLAQALVPKGCVDEGIAEYRKALALQPEAWGFKNLGLVLHQQGRLEEAIAAFRKAIALKADYANAHHDLGVTLRQRSALDEAIAELRKAVKLKPNAAMFHRNLGLALRDQGKFVESLAALRRSHELPAKSADSPQRSAELVREAEELVRLDALLPALLKGDKKPATEAEQLLIVRLCYYKHLYSAAARFCIDALAPDPASDADRNASSRYNAACTAVLAACDHSTSANTLNASQRARLRKQAGIWLRANLAFWATSIGADKSDKREARLKLLRHSQQDVDLAGIRDKGSLAELPEAERQDWQQFWQDVDALLTKLDVPVTKK